MLSNVEFLKNSVNFTMREFGIFVENHHLSILLGFVSFLFSTLAGFKKKKICVWKISQYHLLNLNFFFKEKKPQTF